MNRAERRRQEKAQSKYATRQTFNKKEYDTGLHDAYKRGQRIVIQAAQEILQLGPTRIDRLYARVVEIEIAEGIRKRVDNVVGNVDK